MSFKDEELSFIESGNAPRLATNRALWAIVSCVTLSAVAGSMAFPILPIHAVRAGVVLPLVGLILAANRIGRIVTTPVVGAIVDRLGARSMLIGGLIAQIIVMLMYVLGIATSYTVTFLLLGRLLHGLSSASVFVSAQTLALRIGGARECGRAAGIARAAMAAGIPLGLVIGGIFSDLYGATAVFVGAGLATAGGLLAVLMWLDENVGTALAATSIKSMLRQLRNHYLAAVGILSFVASFAVHGVVMTTLVLLIQAREVSLFDLGAEGTSGVMMGFMAVLIAGGSPIMGVLGDRRRAHGQVTLIGISLCVPALAVIGLADSPWTMGVGLALIGLAAAAIGPSLLALVNQYFSAGMQGSAVSIVQLCGDVGGMLGPLVATIWAGTDQGMPYLVSSVVVLFSMPTAAILAWHEVRSRNTTSAQSADV